MKTFELTKEAIETICKCITYKIESLIDENTYLEDIPDEYERNLIEIGSLKTLINYLDS